MPISSPQHSPDSPPDSPLLIHGESTRPLGVRIHHDFLDKIFRIDEGIRIFDATVHFPLNVNATLDSNLRIHECPQAGGFGSAWSAWYNLFGHEFESKDVNRVFVDGELIWIPRKDRPKKERYDDILEKGIVRLELLDYPEIVEFIQQNREALSRLGLEFDK